MGRVAHDNLFEKKVDQKGGIGTWVPIRNRVEIIAKKKVAK